MIDDLLDHLSERTFLYSIVLLLLPLLLMGQALRPHLSAETVPARIVEVYQSCPASDFSLSGPDPEVRACGTPESRARGKFLWVRATHVAGARTFEIQMPAAEVPVRPPVVGATFPIRRDATKPHRRLEPGSMVGDVLSQWPAFLAPGLFYGVSRLTRRRAVAEAAAADGSAANRRGMVLRMAIAFGVILLGLRGLTGLGLLPDEPLAMLMAAGVGAAAAARLFGGRGTASGPGVVILADAEMPRPPRSEPARVEAARVEARMPPAVRRDVVQRSGRAPGGGFGRRGL